MNVTLGVIDDNGQTAQLSFTPGQAFQVGWHLILTAVKLRLGITPGLKRGGSLK